MAFHSFPFETRALRVHRIMGNIMARFDRQQTRFQIIDLYGTCLEGIPGAP